MQLEGCKYLEGKQQGQGETEAETNDECIGGATKFACLSAACLLDENETGLAEL